MIGQRLRILVVDDDEVDRLTLKRTLVTAGIDADVIEAENGTQALTAVTSGRIDCVLLDYLLPAVTGAELLVMLREADPLNDAPVIMLTGMGDETVAVGLMKAGAADYIPKSSVTPERISTSIRSAMSVRLAERTARQVKAEHHRYVYMLRSLLEAGPRINSTLHPETLIAVAASEACRVLNARRAYVAVRLPGERVISATSLRGKADAQESDPPWKALWNLVREAQQPCRLGARELEALLGAACGPLQSALAVPFLTRDGTLVGVLQIIDAEGGEFSDADEVIASALAQIVAVAMENARLHEVALAATRACDEIRAIVCHDLRTPLGTIQLGATLVRELVPDSIELRGVIKRIDIACGHMQQLLADLLEGTRMGATGLRVAPTDVPVPELLDAAMSLSTPHAEAHRVRLETGAVETDFTVRADRSRVLQVLSNLLGNAIKFTPSGGRIEVAAVREGNEVRFTVRDTGPGIAPEHMPRVFDMFWQRDDTPRKGIGLGLYIAKTIVAAHRGRIWVEDAPGGGTAFHFTLPAADEDAIAV